MIAVIVIYNDSEHYRRLRRYWRSYCRLVDGVMVVFSRGNGSCTTEYPPPVIANGDTIWCAAEESLYPGIVIKTLETIRWILRHHPEVMFIYRTNVSSFVNLHLLKSYCQKLPSEKQFHGRLITTVAHNIPCLSGAGYLLSRDLAEYIVNHQQRINFNLYDDQAIGQLLFDYLGGHYVSVDSVVIEDVQAAKQVSASRTLFHYRIKFTPREAERQVHRRLRRQIYFPGVVKHQQHKLLKLGDNVEYHPSLISREQALYAVAVHGGRSGMVREINERVVKVYHHGTLMYQWDGTSVRSLKSVEVPWCFIIINTTDNRSDVENVRSVLDSYNLPHTIEVVNLDRGLIEWFGDVRLAGYIVAARKVADKCRMVLIVESDVMFPPRFETYLRSLKSSVSPSSFGRGLVASRDGLITLEERRLSDLISKSSFDVLKSYHRSCNIEYLLANNHRVQWFPSLLAMVKLTPDQQQRLIDRLTLSRFYECILRYP